MIRGNLLYVDLPDNPSPNDILKYNMAWVYKRIHDDMLSCFIPDSYIVSSRTEFIFQLICILSFIFIFFFPCSTYIHYFIKFAVAMVFSVLLLFLTWNFKDKNILNTRREVNFRTIISLIGILSESNLIVCIVYDKSVNRNILGIYEKAYLPKNVVVVIDKDIYFSQYYELF